MPFSAIFVVSVLLSTIRPALGAPASSPACAIPQVFSYSTSIADSASIVDLVSGQCGFDGPKARPINETTWDWWYFDAISLDAQQAISIQFIAAPGTALYATGFPPDQILATVVQVYHDGQASIYGGPATGATVVTTGNGASGNWDGTGATFLGAPDMSEYTLIVDNDDYGVKGTMKLKSTAPAHYIAGPAQAGSSMELIAGVGWANAVPDADSEVSFSVNGTEIQFKGSGYHDKNWGDSPFSDRVATWYWGHARLGPYAVVWFQTTAPDGTETVSAYVAENGSGGGEILFASESGLQVRPLGDFAYPPVPGDNPAGFEITIDMGGDQGVLEATVTTIATTYDGLDGTHTRWVGTISGGIVGGERYEGGPAYYEQFALLDGAAE